MTRKTVDLNHVRGGDAPESMWLAANGLSIAMIPVAQHAVITQIDDEQERIEVLSFLKDAAGNNLVTGSGYVKAPINMPMTAQPEDFGITPTHLGA